MREHSHGTLGFTMREPLQMDEVCWLQPNQKGAALMYEATQGCPPEAVPAKVLTVCHRLALPAQRQERP